MQERDDEELSLQALGLDLTEEEPPIASTTSTPNRRLWMGALVAGTTVVGTLALTAPFVLSRSPLPYMATPGHKIKRALEFVQTTKTSQPGAFAGGAAAARQQHTFIDLGSGDGEGVYQAVQSGYEKAVGIELNWTLCTLSRIRRRLFWDGLNTTASSGRRIPSNSTTCRSSNKVAGPYRYASVRFITTTR